MYGLYVKLVKKPKGKKENIDEKSVGLGNTWSFDRLRPEISPHVQLDNKHLRPKELTQYVIGNLFYVTEPMWMSDVVGCKYGKVDSS